MKKPLIGLLCFCSMAVMAALTRNSGVYVTGNYGGEPFFAGEGNNQTAPWINFTSNGVSIFSIPANGVLSFSASSIAIPSGSQTLSITANTNGYSEVNLQNTSSGTNASSDFVVTADNGSASTYYGDFGINSSTFLGGAKPGGTNTVYLISVGTVDNSTNSTSPANLFVGSAQTNSSITLSAGNGLAATNVQINATGLFVYRGIYSQSTNTSMPSPINGQVIFCTSNYNVYVVTPTKTNLVVAGQ